MFHSFLQRFLPFSTVKHRQKIIRSKMSLADNCFIFQNEILPSPLNCINPYPSLDRVLWKFEGLECSFFRFSEVATNHTTIGHVSEKLRRNTILYEYNWHYLKNHHFFNKNFQSSFWMSAFIINIKAGVCLFVCGHYNVRTLTSPPVLKLWGTQGYLWLPYDLTEVIKLIGETFEQKKIFFSKKYFMSFLPH